MKDLMALAVNIPRDIPERKQKEILCDALLAELRTLTGRELSQYLTKFALCTCQPREVVELAFPLRAHVLDPDSCDGEAEGGQRTEASSNDVTGDI